jgi:dolichol-phosphate mannosyltransferase
MLTATDTRLACTDVCVRVLAGREEFRDEYGRRLDPIREDRLLWRAQSFRHIVHLLPGHDVLQLGAGDGLFTSQLFKVSRGENPITAVRFLSQGNGLASSPEIETVQCESFPGPLQGRTFDLICGIDLIDQRNCEPFLAAVFSLLKPGGQVMFYESNPRNPVLKIRRVFDRTDHRLLLSASSLEAEFNRAGFTATLAIYNDFVFAPLNPTLIWLLRNLSLVLENTPGARTLAGSILVSAQKPGGQPVRVQRPICEHASLRKAISVVVPCHNEEMNVRPLVSRLLELYRDYIHEIILVDDNSHDETARVIREVAAEEPLVRGVFRSPPNGVGRALADGYSAATGRYVLSLDCDFVHLLPEIRDLFDSAAEGHEVVIGSRFSRHSVLLNYPVQKIIANRAFHLLARLMLRRKFRDLTNNLKLLKIEVVRALGLSEPHFAVNAETGLRPLLMGFSVSEVPISWINRTADMGVSSFRLAKVGGGYWRVLARLAIVTRFGWRGLRRGPAA